MKNFLLVSFLCLLSACETFPAKPENFDKQSRIAVVSLMGDEVNITMSVPFIFAVKSKDFDAYDWNVDSEIEKMLIDGFREREYLATGRLDISNNENFLDKLKAESYLYGNKFVNYVGSPDFIKLLESSDALRKNDYILFIYPSVASIPGTYTTIKRYGYYSDSGTYLFKFISGSYALLDTKNGKVVGSWHSVETFISSIKIRKLFEDEKMELFKYVTYGMKNEENVKLYKSLIFDGEISDMDRNSILKIYSSDNGSDEDVLDELHNIRMMLSPIHHTPENYENLPEHEKKRLDDGLFEVQQSFVNKILHNFN